MAATDPRYDREPEEDRYGRPTLASTPISPSRRSRWVTIAIVIAVLVVAGVIAFMAFYGGDGSGGGTGGGTGGDGGGLYGVAFALTMDQARRLRNRISPSRER